MKFYFIDIPSPFLLDNNVFPSLGMLYVAGALRKQGVNAFVGQLNEFPDEPDYIGISATTPQFSTAIEAVKQARRRFKKAKIVIGGCHATLKPQDFLNVADYVVTGEADWDNLMELIEGSDEQIIRLPRHMDLNNLPYPARDLIDLNKYHYLIKDNHGREYRTSSLMTSRGCPYNCGFCSAGVRTGGVTFRGHLDVIEELRQLKGLGYEAVHFFDDTFSFKKDRMLGIAEGLHNLGMKWRCFVRANTVDYEVMKTMKESGCLEVGCGVESGSQKILDNVNKKTTVEMNTKLMDNARRAGLRVKTFILIGLPGETHETIAETKKWIIENKPPIADICIFVPYPDSDIVNYKEKYDIDWCREAWDNYWYKGHQETVKSMVWTKGLTRDEITEYRKELEQTYQNERG